MAPDCEGCQCEVRLWDIGYVGLERGQRGFVVVY